MSRNPLCPNINDYDNNNGINDVKDHSIKPCNDYVTIIDSDSLSIKDSLKGQTVNTLKIKNGERGCL